MIQETKKFSMADLARVVSSLVFAKEYFKEQVLMYNGLFNKEAPPMENGELLPLSPLAELYQILMQDAVRNMHTIDLRINRLQGIADSTFLPDLDENQFLNNYPLER